MPTYTYRCRSCDHVFDRFQRITADPVATCDSCGAEQCTRQISGGTFHLKGSGWYASDYGSKTPAPPATACNGEGPKAGCTGPCADQTTATT